VHQCLQALTAFDFALSHIPIWPDEPLLGATSGMRGHAYPIKVVIIKVIVLASLLIGDQACSSRIYVVHCRPQIVLPPTRSGTAHLLQLFFLGVVISGWNALIGFRWLRVVVGSPGDSIVDITAARYGRIFTAANCAIRERVGDKAPHSAAFTGDSAHLSNFQLNSLGVTRK